MIASLFKKIFNKLSGGSSDLNRELYVGNIEYRTTQQELRDLFSEFGDIESIKIIRDSRTKRSKGYGFIKFYKQLDATNALNNMNFKPFRGRELRIAFAKDANNNSD